jgi:hypothetical protein
MSDRLLLYNKSNNTYTVFAKSFGDGYRLANVDNLKKFLEESDSYEEIVVGDLDILDDYAADINPDNSWVYYPPEVHEAYIASIKEMNEKISSARAARSHPDAE